MPPAFYKKWQFRKRAIQIFKILWFILALLSKKGIKIEGYCLKLILQLI